MQHKKKNKKKREGEDEEENGSGEGEKRTGKVDWRRGRRERVREGA
jgi:hypothetical protein